MFQGFINTAFLWSTYQWDYDLLLLSLILYNWCATTPAFQEMFLHSPKCVMMIISWILWYPLINKIQRNIIRYTHMCAFHRILWTCIAPSAKKGEHAISLHNKPCLWSDELQRHRPREGILAVSVQFHQKERQRERACSDKSIQSCTKHTSL